MKSLFRLRLLLVCASLSTFAFGQFTVTPATAPPLTPINLLQQIFLGDGVEVLNIQYIGDPNAIGFFQGAGGILGVGKGVVMSTGNVVDIPTANNISSSTGVNTIGGADADLANIAANNINDAAIYIIDFIPQADTLRFRYVFGSEEYTDFVCSFNDVFGFFISGPGIVGPYTNLAKNIALVPNTNTSVGIGTINNGNPAGTTPPCILTNTQYYVDNDFVTAPATSNFPIIFDGFTTVLTATAIVQPCKTYRIKLAVGDALDNIYDSAVFLEASSFGVSGLSVVPTTPSFDNTISEGCQPVVVDFVLNSPAESPYPVNFTVGGSAIMGVDYDSIPLSGIIPVGQDSLRLFIHALEDGVAEGTDTIALVVNITPCKTDTFYVFIKDKQLVIPVVSDTLICLGDTIQLDATLPIVLEPGAKFVADTTLVFSDIAPLAVPINVNNLPISYYQVGAIDSVCFDIEHLWADDVDAYLVAPDNKFLELTTDNGGYGQNYLHTCFSPYATAPIVGTNNLQAPFSGLWMPEGDWSYLNNAVVNGNWKLQLSDDQPFLDGTFKRWSLNFKPTYFLRYEWSPAQGLSCTDCPNPLVFPDTTTLYFITVTDAYGCAETDSVRVIVADALPAPLATCTGVGVNQLTLSWHPVAGANGYEVSTNNGAFVAIADTFLTLAGLLPNATTQFIYRATGGNCPPNLVDTAFCTTQPCQLTVSVDTLLNIPCNGQGNGSILVSAANGQLPFSFSLNNGTPNATGFFNNLTANNYAIIASDADNCKDTLSFAITQPQPFQANAIATNALCFGSNTGTATVATTGGSMPFAYHWNSSPAQNTATAVNLAAGTYSVTVSDANNCTATASATVGQPTALQSLVTATPTACFGANTGTATVAANGGTGAKQFVWNTGQTASSISNLASGKYVVSITDANGCTRTDSANVLQPDSIALQVAVNPIGCAGANTGTATALATGGTPPFTYIWNTTPPQLTATATNLTIGNYAVTATDTKGCSQTRTVTMTQSTPILLTTASTPAACVGVANGTASVTATGGKGSFSYLWSTTPPQTTAIATNITAGNYGVAVTDSVGCTVVANVQVAALTSVQAAVTVTDATCAGVADGTATVAAVNGTLPYTYLWSTNPPQTTVTALNLAAGTYNVLVTDAVGCTAIAAGLVLQPQAMGLTTFSTAVNCFSENDGTAWVEINGGTAPYEYRWNTAPFQANDTAFNLTAQTYTVTVTDANGCIATQTSAVAQPPRLQTSATTIANPCIGYAVGAATASASGGTPPYTYRWALGNQTTRQINQLAAGTYLFTVTDANGCTQTDSATVGEPSTGLTMLLQTTDPPCYGINNGSVKVTPVNGTPPYRLSTGGSNFGQALHKVGLSPGNYLALLEDASGCTASDSFTIQQPSLFSVSLGDDRTILLNRDTIMIRSFTQNGIPPFKYGWSPADAAFSCLDCPTLLVDGLQNQVLITLTVTDSMGCQAADRLVVYVRKPRLIYVATAFSPNGDLTNDRLFVQGDADIASVAHFAVFDRWGEKVFEATDQPINTPDAGWDGTFNGKPLNAGVFGWMATVVFSDGAQLTFKGNTSLVR